MKAVVLFEAGKAPVVEREEPRPGRGEVLIRVRRCGVCGTDASLYRGDYPASYPVVLGHELSGDVVEVGEGVSGMEIGTRVTVDPNVLCGRCDYCRDACGHLCENLSSMGVHRDGADAEYVAAPVINVYRLPETLSYAEAAFCEPLACAVHGVDLAGVRLGDTVLVVGGGPMGNLLVQCALHAGAAEVVVSEPVAGRRERALESGATRAVDPTKEDLAREVRSRKRIGADVVFEAAGNPSAQERCLSLVKKGGTVVYFGVSPSSAVVGISPFFVNENEIRIIGSFNNPATMQRSLDLLEGGACRVGHLISHEIGLRDFDRVWTLFGAPEALKLMVDTG